MDSSSKIIKPPVITLWDEFTPEIERTCDSSSGDGKLYIPIPQNKVFAPNAAHCDGYAIVRDKRDKSMASADSRYGCSVQVRNVDLAQQASPPPVPPSKTM
jgi:hypothetical protein